MRPDVVGDTYTLLHARSLGELTKPWGSTKARGDSVVPLGINYGPIRRAGPDVGDGRDNQSNKLRVRLSKRRKNNLRSETLQSEKIRGLSSNRNEPELDREFDQISGGLSAKGFHHFILMGLCRAG